MCTQILSRLGLRLGLGLSCVYPNPIPSHARTLTAGRVACDWVSRFAFGQLPRCPVDGCTPCSGLNVTFTTRFSFATSLNARIAWASHYALWSAPLPLHSTCHLRPIGVSVRLCCQCGPVMQPSLVGHLFSQGLFRDSSGVALLRSGLGLGRGRGRVRFRTRIRSTYNPIILLLTIGA